MQLVGVGVEGVGPGKDQGVAQQVKRQEHQKTEAGCGHEHFLADRGPQQEQVAFHGVSPEPFSGFLDNFLKNNDDIAEEIPNYYIEFFKNNHYDQNIVPKHNPYSKLIYPMTFVLDEKSRKEYAIALAEGEIPPPIRRGYIWNSEQGSQSITVLGSRNLNNYTGDIMIPSNKFKVSKPGGTKYNYRGYRKKC